MTQDGRKICGSNDANMAATSSSVSPHSQTFASLVPKLVSESLGIMLGLRSFQYLTLFDPILVAVKAWNEANGLFCLVAGYLSFSLHTFMYLLQEVSLSTPA